MNQGSRNDVVGMIVVELSGVGVSGRYGSVGLFVGCVVLVPFTLITIIWNWEE